MTAFVNSIVVQSRRSVSVHSSRRAITSTAPLRPRLAPRRAHITAQPMRATATQPGAPAPPLVVMVNGVPGRMAAATAEAVVERGLALAEEALTGPGMGEVHSVGGGRASIALAPPDDHEAALRRMVAKHPGLIVVDYTHPSAANRNVEMYVAAGANFVIGTTGGDAAAMHAAVEGAAADRAVRAVIAPNMGKQIVAFQAIMEMMAEQFPGAFAGYQLSVKESHQSTKADTSGTAKAVVASMNKLGLDYSVDSIDKLRTKERSMQELHVPEEYIDAGHAFHTYHIATPDGTVNFEFQHNVCGRKFYAEGTVDAVKFLHNIRHAASPPDKRIFSMIDILRSGAMS